MKNPRSVKIETVNGVHYVEFVERRKGQRYLAAQFDARDNSIDKVKEWIKNNPNLKLSE